jgi:hypothetical protein
LSEKVSEGIKEDERLARSYAEDKLQMEKVKGLVEVNKRGNLNFIILEMVHFFGMMQIHR